MYILGINAYHGDSSACLVKDGILLAALEEERIRRIKHWAGFPSEAIKFCLSFAGISPRDLDYIAISRNPLARLHKKIWRVILKAPSFDFLKSRVGNFQKIKSVKENIAELYGVKENTLKAQLVNVEHHRAHIASSFFVSPFSEAAVVSVDGFGDFCSAMIGVGEGNKMKILSEVNFPHSLGIFYTALTQFLGFLQYGDEYKVMGLSAFGDPSYFGTLKPLVKLKSNGLFALDNSYFLHAVKGVEMTWLNEKPVIGRLFSNKLIELFGNPRDPAEELNEKYNDIAASVQKVYEEAFFHVLNNIAQKIALKNVALAGGCLQNSLANGKIFSRTPFKEIYIPPAAHDAGTAIGAAYYVWHEILNQPRQFIMTSAFWGPAYEDKIIATALKSNNLKFQRLDQNNIIQKTASLLAQGKIVGWFEGRTEWGPRALGNRSILANPGLPNIKEILNLKIKKREPFRPFAPSILEEKVNEYFDVNYPVPFMEKVYIIKSEKRKIIPAVTHVDGTGRLQTVSAKNNELYYRLIQAFYKITGLPLLLNTSFNENEPIVNHPEEAIDCFERTKMDILVVGNYLVERS